MEVASSSRAPSTTLKPKILLMGLRRSGKSSILRVVFAKMSPHETLFLEPTVKVQKHDVSNNSFVQFEIWDFPGQSDCMDASFDAETAFSMCGSLVFVVDSQDDTYEAEATLVATVLKAYEVNPRINVEVFIHKVDGLSDDHKSELHRNLQQRVNEDLNMNKQNGGLGMAVVGGGSGSAGAGGVNGGGGGGCVHLSFHLTSIYDHSVFEAFSKVIQKLIPQLPTLENLLDMFASNSRIEKAFLFDVLTKIYIASGMCTVCPPISGIERSYPEFVVADTSPVDNTTYELCSDMIDVMIDVSLIYGWGENPPMLLHPSFSDSLLEMEDAATGGGGATSSSSCHPMMFPFHDPETSSVIRLSNGMVLYLKQVNQYLALVCLLHDYNFNKFGLINYNFAIFKQSIGEVFDIRSNIANSVSSSAASSGRELKVK